MKLEEKKITSKDIVRSILVVISLAVIVIGIILLGRAYIIQNRPTESQVTDPNVKVNDIQNDLNDGVDTVVDSQANWSTGIVNPLNLPKLEASSVWLSILANNNHNIGALNPSIPKNDHKFLIPGAAELIKFYENNALSYVIDNTLYVDFEGTSTQIIRLPLNLRISSYTFDTVDKEFYVLARDLDTGAQTLKLITARGKLIDLNKSVLKTINEIIWYSNVEDTMYLRESGNLCYKLKVESNELSALDFCHEAYPKQNQKEMIWTNYKAFSGELVTGEIYKFDASLNKQNIYTLPLGAMPGDVIKSFTKDNAYAFITYNQTFNSTSWEATKQISINTLIDGVNTSIYAVAEHEIVTLVAMDDEFVYYISNDTTKNKNTLLQINLTEPREIFTTELTTCTADIECKFLLIKN